MKQTDGHVRIMVTSDLHYLSEELYDPDSPIFAMLMSKNDGKCVTEGKAILDALVNRAIAEKPDVLILCGDITFNGELISLEEVHDALIPVKEAGVPVLVTTGNHDISYRSSMTYFGEAPEYTENISSAAWADVMHDFGYEDALYRDEETLSYVYALRDDLRFLVLDCNSREYPGSLPASTLTWMETVLEEAEEEGITAVAVSHQNVLKQNDLMYQGYVINNHEAVQHILTEHGVYLCLSGHSHLQHTARDEELTDICSESVSVWPLQYGTVDLDPENRSFVHETVSLGIAQEKAYRDFADTVGRMSGKAAEEAVSDPETAQAMTDFAVEMNAAFFSGNIEKVRALAEDERKELWEQYGKGSFFLFYMENILAEYGNG